MSRFPLRQERRAARSPSRTKIIAHHAIYNKVAVCVFGGSGKFRLPADAHFAGLISQLGLQPFSLEKNSASNSSVWGMAADGQFAGALDQTLAQCINRNGNPRRILQTLSAVMLNMWPDDVIWFIHRGHSRCVSQVHR